MYLRPACITDCMISADAGLRHCRRVPGRRASLHTPGLVQPAFLAGKRKTHVQNRNNRSDKNLVCAAESGTSTTGTECYARQLADCEASGDWVRAVELLTEVRILKVDMPTAGYEAAIRLCASNGQWEKAVTVVREVRAARVVSADTLDHVFSVLAREKQGRTALDLLQELNETKGWEAYTPETRAVAHNCTIRSCARGGMLDEALALLEETSQLKVDVHAPTYSALAVACMEAGQEALAEQMLEERDYL